MEPDQAQALEEVTQATRDLEVTWLQDEIETARGELRRTLQDPEVQRTLSYVLEIERLRKEVGELESRGRRTQTGADAERGEAPLFTTPGEDPARLRAPQIAGWVLLKLLRMRMGLVKR